MSSDFGRRLKISLFGESHGEKVGVVIDGMPAGEPVDMDELSRFLSRRRPGSGPLVTDRCETDDPEFLSGVKNGFTCGTPICIAISNGDAKSASYDADVPRPSHGDLTHCIKSRGFADLTGGGHFSGRLTAPLCAAGGVFLQALKRRGVRIGAHLLSVGAVEDDAFDPVSPDLDAVSPYDLPVINKGALDRMKTLILSLKEEGDSVGGVVECAITGLPAGIGDPIFYGVENALSSAVFGIPGVRGIEFGAGFRASSMTGSAHNDAFFIDDGVIKTKTNNHGGVLGGISSGMPVIFRAAIKPTPSIGKKQDSVSMSKMSEKAIAVSGRHDPCVALRAVPCIEAAAASAILDLMLFDRGDAF